MSPLTQRRELKLTDAARDSKHKMPPRAVNRPRLCRQHKKPRVQDYTVLAGVAQCQRRHSCFRLDALVVVKVDVTVNHLIGF